MKTRLVFCFKRANCSIVPQTVLISDMVSCPRTQPGTALCHSFGQNAQGGHLWVSTLGCHRVPHDARDLRRGQRVCSTAYISRNTEAPQVTAPLLPLFMHLSSYIFTDVGFDVCSFWRVGSFLSLQSATCPTCLDHVDTA